VHIVVHHLDKSRSHRILWFLEEVEEPYELRIWKRDPSTWRAPAELKEVHPRGRAPVVELDGTVLAESGAILETLAERLHSPLLPDRDSDDFAHHRYFLHYAEGSLMTPLLVGLIMGRTADAPVPFFVKPVVRQIAKKVNESDTWPELEAHAAFLESHLEHHPWFSGTTLGIADIQMSYGVLALVERATVRTPIPKLRDWLARVKARPAYQRAVAKGGPPV
jgi:glutathione S-transferase